MLLSHRSTISPRSATQGRVGPTIVFTAPVEARRVTTAAVSRVLPQPARSRVGLLARLRARLGPSGEREATRALPSLPPQPAVGVPSRALSSGGHWARVAAVVDRATNSAMLVREAQLAARGQLEMAEYALDLLFDEVATVMPISRKVRSLRPLPSAAPARPIAMAA